MRWRRRIDADIDEAIDAVGWDKPKPPAAGAPTHAPRPLPGPPRRTLTIHLYDDGHAETYDHQRQRWTYTPGKPPRIDLSDGALERFLRDQH